MKLSAFEKQIYNTHLKYSRQYQNKPWRPRENFEKLSEKEEECIKSISKILISKNIDCDHYFMAPYELWDDQKYLQIDYFSKYKAIKTYYKWIEKLMYENPEHKVIVELIKRGYLYIYEKCEQLKLSNLEQYFELKSFYPEFLINLQEKKIIYYNIIPFNNYEKNLKNFPRYDVDFIVPGFYNSIESVRVRYYKSDKLKNLNKKIITKLNKILIKNYAKK